MKWPTGLPLAFSGPTTRTNSLVNNDFHGKCNLERAPSCWDKVKLTLQYLSPLRINTSFPSHQEKRKRITILAGAKKTVTTNRDGGDGVSCLKHKH
ncbi:hypothetical protein ACM6XU_004595 [Vibrio parahaemolyticus]